MLLKELELMIEHKSAVIGVIGLGYVGLPVAACFADIGFEVEQFGGDSFAVRSYPAALGQVNINEEFEKILFDLIEIELSDNKQKLARQFISKIACHSAIRANA